MQIGFIALSLALFMGNSGDESRHSLTPFKPDRIPLLLGSPLGYAGLPSVIADDALNASFVTFAVDDGYAETDAVMNQLARDLRPAKPAQSFLSQYSADRFAPDATPLTGPVAAILSLQHRSVSAQVRASQPAAPGAAQHVNAWANASMWCALALSPSLKSSQDRMQFTGACHGLAQSIISQGGIDGQPSSALAKLPHSAVLASWEHGKRQVASLVQIDQLVNRPSNKQALGAE